MSRRTDANEVRTLRDRYGDEVELAGDGRDGVSYRILTEFAYNGREYAALESDELRKEGEIAIFRIDRSSGEPQLGNIEDDEEWETVSEIADDWTFGAGLDEA